MFYQLKVVLNIALITLVAATLSACSGGGRSLRGAGNYCAENVNKLISKVPKKSLAVKFEFKSNGDYFTKKENELDAKRRLNAGEIKLAEYKQLTQQTEFLPPGKYVLEESKFLYYQVTDPSEPREAVRSQINEKQLADGTYTAGAHCDGGYSLITPSFTTQIEGLESLTIDMSGKANFTTREWGFVWNQDKLRKTPLFGPKDDKKWAKESDSSRYSSPKDVFPETEATLSVHQLENKEDTFILIYEQRIDDETTLYLRQDFKRSDLPEKEGQEGPDDFFGEERS